MAESRVTASAVRIRRSIPDINWLLAAALLIAGAAAWPLLSQPGLLNTRGGGDSPFLLQRLQQLSVALADGHFPVRWMPDANYGFGYPFFNYYAPLSIYIAAAFRFLGFGYVQAIELGQLLGFLVGAWAMFSLAQRWFASRWAGLLASVAYTLAPFHLVNVYVRGDSLAEFWAMAFYPLVLLAADHLIAAWQSGDRHALLKRFALLTLAFAGLVLSHNISALIFTPFLILYLLIRALLSNEAGHAIAGPHPNRLGLVKWLLLALGVGLLLSAWFWLPALAERSWAQLEPVTSGYFHYGNHFRAADIVQRALWFDYDVSGGNAFRMGFVQALTIALGILVLLFWPRRASADQTSSEVPAAQITADWPTWATKVFIVLALLAATFMVTPLSRPLWDHLPLLSYTQFPWRFLSVQAFAGALATAGLALLPGRRLIVPLIAGLLLLTALAGLQTDQLQINDRDVTTERLAEYEWFTGNIGSTVSAEYLPPTVQPRPFTSRWLNEGSRFDVQALNGELGDWQQVTRQAASQEWRLVVASPEATVILPTLYWPGWQAAIDGQPALLEPAPGSGLMMIKVPAGQHTLSLRLSRTPVRLVAEILALGAGLFVVWLIRPPRGWRPGLRLASAVAAIVILLLVARLWSDPALSADDLNWDFAQMGYLHHAPQGVAYDNGASLLNYTYSHEEIGGGQELAVTLNWQPGSSGQAQVALVTPASNRHEGAPVLVEQTQSLVGPTSVFRLAIPQNSPAGLYVPRVTIAGAKPLTPSGLTRGDLFLRPVRVLASSGSEASSHQPLEAQATAVTQRNPELVDVQLQWRTQQPLSRNYNVSLRLVDAHGVELAQFDSQPGYGFQPSSGWPPGEWVDDWLALPLPADPPIRAASEPYALVVRLYDVETGVPVLVRRLGQMVWREDRLVFGPVEPLTTLPQDIVPMSAIFDDSVELRGYTLTRVAGSLDLTLYWQALMPLSEDLRHFVHLVDPGSGEIVAQHDSMPAQNSYPTSQWSAGEIVADGLRLDVREVPPGDYQLVIGLYRKPGDEIVRLPGVDSSGRPLADDRLLLVAPLSVEG